MISSTDTPKYSAIFCRLHTLGDEMSSAHFPIVPLEMPQVFSSAEIEMPFSMHSRLMLS